MIAAMVRKHPEGLNRPRPASVLFKNSKVKEALQLYMCGKEIGEYEIIFKVVKDEYGCVEVISGEVSQ
jgi:hypothetical protein